MDYVLWSFLVVNILGAGFILYVGSVYRRLIKNVSETNCGLSHLTPKEEQELMTQLLVFASQYTILRKEKLLIHQISCREPLGEDCTCGLNKILEDLTEAFRNTEKISEKVIQRKKEIATNESTKNQ